MGDGLQRRRPTVAYTVGLRVIALRVHQERGVQQLREGSRAGHLRQLLVMPTGAGKTITAAGIALLARKKGRIALFIVDRIAIADQAVETMHRVGLRPSVLRGEDSRIIAGHDVIVASIQTLARRRIPDADLLIIDEAHVLHQAHANLLDRWDAVPVIGLTATPFTRGMGQWFTNLVVPTSIRELMGQGLLVPVTPFGPSKPDLDGVRTRAGDYVAGELAARMNRVELHADVVATWRRLGENRQTLVFCVDVAHAKAVSNQFAAAGIRSEHVDGYQESGDRQGAIRRFREGEITVLCSVACLSVGFDAPNASCLILARPTKSLTLHLQQIGRGLRPHPGKSDCIIIDHACNIERHGLPEDIEIGELDEHSKTWGTLSRKEPLPKPCAKCSILKPLGTHKCPRCGFAPERQCDVATIDAEIVPLTYAARLHATQRLYQEFLGCARAMGMKDGWAYHLLKAKTGHPPERTWRDLPPMTPTEETLRYAKSQLIRHANARRSG